VTFDPPACFFDVMELRDVGERTVWPQGSDSDNSTVCAGPQRFPKVGEAGGQATSENL
jgi:hypothetical protein